MIVRCNEPVGQRADEGGVTAGADGTVGDRRLPGSVTASERQQDLGACTYVQVPLLLQERVVEAAARLARPGDTVDAATTRLLDAIRTADADLLSETP